MCMQLDDHQPRNTLKIAALFAGIFIALQLLSVPKAAAVEKLSAEELGLHCVLLSSSPEGADGQYCIRYIQGFIDGAVATDARVMLSMEDLQNHNETFTERATRTRMPSHADHTRAANLAGFCLGDPLPLRDVVNAVVADLAVLPKEREQNASAMEVVYASLKRHYPCES